MKLKIRLTALNNIIKKSLNFSDFNIHSNIAIKFNNVIIMFFNNSLKQFEILNRNHLKYIVIIFMLIDHICYFYPPDNPIVIFLIL